jgi:cytochrome c
MWTDLNGNKQQASAVSDPMVPAAAPAKTPAPAEKPSAPVTTTKPSVAATPAPAASAVVTSTMTAKPPAEATEEPAATVTPAPAAPAGNATHGAALFASKNCTACHTVNGQGGTVGPNLSHIATTPYDNLGNDAAFLTKWLHDPKAVKPDTAMPNPNLTDAEITVIVAYLESLKESVYVALQRYAGRRSSWAPAFFEAEMRQVLPT